MSLGERRAMIAPSHPRLSVVRQCALVGLNRSGVYHRPKGESAATLALMRLIDEVFLGNYSPPILLSGSFIRSFVVYLFPNRAASNVLASSR